MQVLLIAEPSEYFRNALKEAFSAHYQVHTCSDGCTALEMIHTLRPDGMIVNLSLPYMDGLSVLQKANYRVPVVMALCATLSGYILQSLQEVGVSFIMPLPCMVWAVLERFRALMEEGQQPSIAREQQRQAAEHLDVLGMPTHLNGYKMLCIAIALYQQDPLQVLSKETYPAVAQILGGKHEVPAIEHAIRSAIRAAWHQRENTAWSEYFSKHKPPSNKRFIMVIAQKLS